MVKIDRVSPVAIDAGVREELVGLARDASADADTALIADFGLGLLTPKAVTDLCGVVRQNVRTLGGDVSGKRATLGAMRDLDWLSPTEDELRAGANDAEGALPSAVWALLERTRSARATVTLGSDGLVVFDTLPGAERAVGMTSRLRAEPIPALIDHPVDTIGCGDALLTSATLALSSGATHTQAAYIGSLAAAAHATTLGNTPLAIHTMTDLMRRMNTARIVVTERARAMSTAV